MAEDSPCRRTPSTMPSSVHSMVQVYRILVKDAAIVAVIPESRIEPALRVAGIGIIQADGGQNTGHDLDAAVEFETVFRKRRQQGKYRQHQQRRQNPARPVPTLPCREVDEIG